MSQGGKQKLRYGSEPNQADATQDEIERLKKEHEMKIAEMKGAMEQKDDRITELEGEAKVKDGRIEELEGQLKETEKQLKETEKQLKELQRREAYHDGPNTPPSKDTITQQKQKRENARSRTPSDKKPGGQPGHRGTTNKPKPTRVEEITMENCNVCGSEDICETHVESKTVTDAPPPPPPTTTKFNTHHYDCNDCGAKDMSAESEEVPKKGAYGPNTIFETVNNFLHRMPNRMNAECQASRGILMSSGTVFAILFMVGMCLLNPAQNIMKALSNARVLHVDETTIKLFGKKIWVWVFYNPETGETLYLLRMKRARWVIQEVLGKSWLGVIICDGYVAYKAYRIQRCWAHLIRGMRDIATKNPNSSAAQSALERLRSIYHDAKQETEPEKRSALRANLRRRVMRLVNRYRDDPVIGEYMRTLERALPDMFRFVLDPTIPSTNNPAEQLLREIVIQRKIRGGIRSEKTMEWLGYLFTCITTWKMQGLDRREQLLQHV